MKFKDAIEFKETIIERELQNEVRTEVVFSCKHCNRPTGWDTLDGIQQHLDQCLYKNDNKRCVMCKHLKIIEEAPYPKNNKLWKSVDTEWALGAYRTPVCMKYDKVLDEEIIHQYNEDCWELGDELPIIERTKEYAKWVELSTQLHEEYKVDVPEEIVEEEE